MSPAAIATGPDQSVDGAGLTGAREEEALGLVTAQRGEGLELSAGFDTLGDDLQAECV